MAFDFAWNFRHSLAGPTSFTGDVAPAQFCDSSFYHPGSGGARFIYPTFSGGVTFGWPGDPGLDNDRDRSGSTGDARTAGVAYVLNTTDLNFRVNLTGGAGDYNIYLAMGDFYGQHAHQYWRIYDDLTLLDTATNLDTVAADNYFDATHVRRTSTANWVTNQAPLVKTFSSTTNGSGGPIFYLNMGDPAHGGGVGGSAIAHLRILQVSSLGPSIPVLMNQYKQRAS